MQQFVQQDSRQPIVVGICGGTGSGKTTVSSELVSELRDRGYTSNSLASDSYVNDQSHLSLRDRGQVNFDHPDALDSQLLREHLTNLRSRIVVHVPVYDPVLHARSDEVIGFEPVDLLILEGILIFAIHEIEDLIDVRVFLDVPEKVRFERRRQRDRLDRGRDPSAIEEQLLKTVRPMHALFVEPYKARADLVISYSGTKSASAIASDVADIIEASFLKGTGHN